MAQVQDKSGNNWNVSVCTSTIIRIKENTDIDLFKVLEDRSVMGRLFGDMLSQAKVLFWCCEQQVKATGKTIEEFLDLWDGDTLQNGMDAIFDSLAAYFPKQKGQALREGVGATKVYVEKIFEKAQKLAQTVQNGAMDKALDDAEKKLLEELQEDLPGPDEPTPGGESSGDVPESSESTPATSP